MADKTVTVRPSGGTYTTLQAAITGEVAANANLVTMDGILTISIEGNWSGSIDTAAVNITGFTQDATHYLKVVCDSSNRAGPLWSTSKYILQRSADTWDTCLGVNSNFTRVIGLQVSSSGSGVAIYMNYGGVIDSCHVRSVSGIGINLGINTAGNTGILSNTIARGCGGRGFDSANSAQPVYYFNCDAIANVGNGFRFAQYDRQYATNCYSGGNTAADYNNSGGGLTTLTTCCSEDGTMSTSTVAYSTSTFTNVTAGSEDLSLVSGSGLIDIGTDLSGSSVYPFNWDITGATRTGTWDVGATEYVASGDRVYSGTGTVAFSGSATVQRIVDTYSYSGSGSVSFSGAFTTGGPVAGLYLYVNTDAVSNGDGTVGNPYNTLANALIAGNSPITRGEDVHIRVIGATHTTTKTTLAGAYTDSTHHLYIHGNLNTYVWDDTKWAVEVNGDNGFDLAGYVHLENVQIHILSAGFADIGVYIAGAGSTWISNSIIRGQGASGAQTYHSGIEANYTGTSSIRIWNNLIYDFVGGNDSIGIWNHVNASMYAYNNTIFNCTYGIAHQQGGAAMLAKNNVIKSCTTNYAGTFVATSTGNTSSDGTRPTTDATNLINQTITFTAEASRDFRLDSSSTSCIDNGEDLSADTYIPFSSDFIGNTRSDWDRGALEYVSVSSDYVYAGLGNVSFSGTAGVSYTSNAYIFNASGNIAFSGAAITSKVEQYPRIVNHENFDPASYSDAQILAAAALDSYFEHASVGQDIVGNSDTDSSAGVDHNGSLACGLHLLYDTNSRYLMSRESFDSSNDYTWFATNNGLQDNNRGNPGAAAKLSGFTSLSANMLAALDVATFKFCYIDTPANGATYAATVIAAIDAMQASNPTVVIPYWTMPLETTAYQQRQIFNDAIRTHCRNNNKWLLDIADIESHNDAGVAQVDGSNYEVLTAAYTDDGGHLDADGKPKMAKAFWTLLVKIAEAIASNAFAYIASGQVAFSGTAPTTRTVSFAYTGNGSVAFSGEASTLETNTYAYTASGTVTFTGTATTSKTDMGAATYTGSGTVTFSGNSPAVATASYAYAASGNIIISGTATTSTTIAGESVYVGSGNIAFSGSTTGTISKTFTYTAMGTAVFYGTAYTEGPSSGYHGEIIILSFDIQTILDIPLSLQTEVVV
jgi:hypothetical protein